MTGTDDMSRAAPAIDRRSAFIGKIGFDKRLARSARPLKKVGRLRDDVLT
jgi:hypothetical protein